MVKTKRKQNTPKQQFPADPSQLSLLIQDRGHDQFIIFPGLPKEYFTLKQDVEQKQAAGEEISFMCPLCKDRKYTTLPGLAFHLQGSRCPANQKQEHTCKICEKVMMDHRTALIHLQVVHVEPYSKTLVKRQSRSNRTFNADCFDEENNAKQKSSKKDKDVEFEDFEEAIESFEYEDEFGSSEAVLHWSKRPYNSTSRVIVSPESPMVEAVSLTYNSRLRTEREHARVPCVVPPRRGAGEEVNLGRLLALGRLHLQRTSPKFCVDNNVLKKPSNCTSKKRRTKQTKKKKKQQQQSSEDENLYQSLSLFETLSSCSNEGGSRSYTAFVGAEVWSLAWMPRSVTPRDDYNRMRDDEDQFLAVATHAGEHLLEPEIIYDETCMLQIWNCGVLPRLPDPQQPSQLYLCLGLVLDIGPVWDMDWRGVYGSQRFSSLGEIAVAGGNGEVTVLAIPLPTSKYPQYKILRPSNYLRLVAHRNLAGRSPFGQCMSVSWSVSDGRALLAAGYMSGHVTLFDTRAESPFLLGPKLDGCQVIFPLTVIDAHQKTIRTVNFSPFNQHVLVTAGSDRRLRLWDITNPNYTVREADVTLSVVYETAWTCNFNGLYAATGCEFVSSGHGCIHFNMGQQPSYLSTVIPFRLTSWSVSVNDWVNGVVSSDSSGCVVLSVHENPKNVNEPSTNPSCKIASQKRLRRLMMYQCKTEWQQSETDAADAPAAPKTTAKSKKKKNVGSSNASSSSTAATKDWGDYYKLRMEDMQLHDLQRYQNTRAYELTKKLEDFPDELLELPVGAVLKCRWNPNMSSMSWVATGTRSGLLRLHCCSGLVTCRVERALNKCGSKDKKGDDDSVFL